MSETRATCFAVCLDNRGYETLLKVGKLYRVVPGEEAAAHGYTRVEDESGEDHAYSSNRFYAVRVAASRGKDLVGRIPASNTAASEGRKLLQAANAGAEFSS